MIRGRIPVAIVRCFPWLPAVAVGVVHVPLNH